MSEIQHPPPDWDRRYAEPEYAYGTAPNDFVSSVAAEIPPGPVLCLAEGQGRNAVFLAGLGHEVTAVDQSAVGLSRARDLASSRGVTIATIAADLRNFAIVPGAWSGIVATFAHIGPKTRGHVHRAVVAGLVPGGVFVLEAYTPAQLAFKTGGPDSPALLMTLEGLRGELAGLECLIGREIEREVVEGRYHRGRAAVVQVLARKPAAG